MFAARLQKGYYHRNVNFQSYVDHAHGKFVSGERLCVDPPHLRMVFDEAVINSLLTASPDQGLQSPSAGQAIHQNTAHAADSSAVGSQLQSRPDSGKNVKAVVGGSAQQISDRVPDDQAVQSHHASLDSHNPAQLAKGHEEWRAVLQQSMQLAKDIRWTHKGLQVKSISCLKLLPAACVHALWNVLCFIAALLHEQHLKASKLCSNFIVHWPS